MSAEEPWYGIRFVYRHARAKGTTYEERILVVRANSAEKAIAKAETISASDYEDDTTERLNYAMAFNIFDCNGPSIGSGTEVFSLMRDSDLTPEEYLNHFHSTGSERAQDIDDSTR